MFSNDPYVHEMYKMLLGDNVHWQDREAWIYSKDVYTRYPFQGALYGLPPEVIKECIVGAIEARFGALKPPRSRPRTTGQANGDYTGARRQGMFEPLHDTANGGHDEAVHTGADRRRLERAQRQRPDNFEEFIYKVWGAGIAKHFAIPYNQKLWAVPLTEMETSLAGRPRAAARSGGNDRGRPLARAQADGPQRPLRLSAARRLPGADERLPAPHGRQAPAQHARH